MPILARMESSKTHMTSSVATPRGELSNAFRAPTSLHSPPAPRGSWASKLVNSGGWPGPQQRGNPAQAPAPRAAPCSPTVGTRVATAAIGTLGPGCPPAQPALQDPTGTVPTSEHSPRAVTFSGLFQEKLPGFAWGNYRAVPGATDFKQRCIFRPDPAHSPHASHHFLLPQHLRKCLFHISSNAESKQDTGQWPQHHQRTPSVSSLHM